MGVDRFLSCYPFFAMYIQQKWKKDERNLEQIINEIIITKSLKSFQNNIYLYIIYLFNVNIYV